MRAQHGATRSCRWQAPFWSAELFQRRPITRPSPAFRGWWTRPAPGCSPRSETPRARFTVIGFLPGRYSWDPTGNVAAVVEVFVHEVATRDYLRRELEEIRDLLADLHRPAGTGPDETGTQAAHRHSKKKGELAVAIAVTTSLPSRYGGVVHR